MRPYGMRGLVALLLIVGMATAASPVGDETARTLRTVFRAGETSAAGQLAAGGSVMVEGVKGSEISEYAPRPSCTLVARPDRIAYGGSTIVRWASEDANHLVVSGLGDVAASGMRVVNGLTVSRTITLRAEGHGGWVTCAAAIEVMDPQRAPTCLISAHPVQVVRGERVSVSWGTEGATSVRLSDRGVVASRGGITLVPQRSRDYTLTVFGPLGQSGTCTTRVTVQQ
jgi:hypothetical protein